MTNRVHCSFFMGAFGAIFSQGVFHLAAAARKLGVTTEVYSYTQGESARIAIENARRKHYRIAGLGYSLGVSAQTELQRRCNFDLVFCIAGSSLGINYPINHSNTRRSVLWYGEEPLSNAGAGLGFGEVNTTHYWHLLAAYDPRVVASFERELRVLINSDHGTKV